MIIPQTVPLNEFHTMIEYAVKAPSGHNSQPWKFALDGNVIRIMPDMERSLPVVDPHNRELFISLGCAAENICLTAKQCGYNPVCIIGADGSIGIQLIKDSTVEQDPLFAVIDKRQSNRKVYNGDRIPDVVANELMRAIGGDGVGVKLYARDSPEFSSIREIIMEANQLQMGDSEFVGELKSWMRFNRRHSRRERDGLAYNVFGAPNLPLFIARPAISSHLKAKKQNKNDLQKIDSSSHFAVFSLKRNGIKEWVLLGMELQRFLLTAATHDVAVAFMNQPCEVAELAVELAGELRDPVSVPNVILRLGYANPAAYSIRRDVSDVLIEDKCFLDTRKKNLSVNVGFNLFLWC